MEGRADVFRAPVFYVHIVVPCTGFVLVSSARAGPALPRELMWRWFTYDDDDDAESDDAEEERKGDPSQQEQETTSPKQGGDGDSSEYEATFDELDPAVTAAILAQVQSSLVE